MIENEESPVVLLKFSIGEIVAKFLIVSVKK